MCNRCDGGNKPLLKFQCDECEFVFYQVDDPDIIEDLTCLKCKLGIGRLVEEGEE